MCAVGTATGEAPCLTMVLVLLAGYYGSNDAASLNESSPNGRDYLAEVCRDWEAAAEPSQTARTVLVRTGAPPLLYSHKAKSHLRLMLSFRCLTLSTMGCSIACLSVGLLSIALEGGFACATR